MSTCMKKYKDEMTPNERMMSFMQGKPVDRIPCTPMIGGVAAKFIGVNIKEMNQSAKLIAESQIKAYEMFGHDSVGVCIGQNPIAVAFGGVMNEPLDDNPSMKEYPIKSEKDLDDLDMSSLDKSDLINKIFEAGKILMDRIGDEVSPSVIISGPFSAAATLRGTNNLLKDLIKNPEFAHKIIDFALAAVTHVTIPFLKEGIAPVIVDPVASGTILDTKKAQEFAYSYTTKLIEEFHKYVPGVILHVCGDTTKQLDIMADTGADCLSLDNIVDLETAKNKVGDRILITGNVDPVNIMYKGTPEMIHNAVKDCLKKAHDNPKGYILSTGCDLPVKTPAENIEVFMDAARIYGKWPLDPNNFI